MIGLCLLSSCQFESFLSSNHLHSIHALPYYTAYRADHLRIPAKIRAGDGTFDTFLSKYITINSSGLGLVSLQELSAYLIGLMGSRGNSRGREGVGSRVPTAASSSAAASRVATAASSGGKSAPRSAAATSSRTGSALRQKLVVGDGMSG
jgi:hypothetical protein